MSELTMDGSVMEGLFVRELKPSGPFKDALAKIGFDMDKLQPKYTEEIFRKAIEVATSYSYPTVTQHAAHFSLGERLIAGYFSTILGRVTAGIIPVIGAKRTLSRIAQLWQVPQPGMKISAREGPEAWVVSFQNVAMSADLVAGIIQAAIRRVDKKLVCTVLLRAPGSGQVSVRLGSVA